MKKSVCVLLAVLLFAGCMFLTAEAAPLMKNGDFEVVNATGYFTSWSTSLSPEGLKGTNAYYGESCLRLSSNTDFALVGQNIAGIEAEETYILEFAFRPESSAFYPYVTITYYDSGQKNIGADVHLSTAAVWKKAPVKNVWQLYETELTTPAGCVEFSVRLRTREAGSVCAYDYVSLTKPIQTETGSSLLENGTFEDMPDGDWVSQSGKWTDNFAYLTSGGYENSACVRITSPENAAYPYVEQYVNGLLGGAEYRVSLLLKTEKITNYVRFKCEFYKTGGTGRESKGESVSGDMTGPENKWVQYTESFVLPEGADTVRLMLRIYGGTGTAYFDNVGLYLAKEPPRATVKTDKVFYYTGTNAGKATITPNALFDTEYTALSAELLCEGNTVGTVSKRPIEETFTFSLSGMTEKKPHTLSVTLYDSAGNPYTVPDTEIYMFPRPVNIGADNLWREEDGTVFHPVFAYHLPEKEYPKAKEAGINLVQAYGRVSTLIHLLDSAAANGMKVLIPLYADGNFAGDAAQRQQTLETVREVKNHPALFGYMIADEPYYVSRTSDIGERLKKAYLTVKEEDIVHPVFLNESSVVPQYFGDAVRYTDVFCIDPYIGADRDPASYVAERTAAAVAAANGEKPVYTLLQTFLYDGHFPTGDEVRNQVYQAFANGAVGIGYYKYDNAKPDAELSGTALWETLRHMAAEELPFLFSSFVLDGTKVTKTAAGVYTYRKENEKYSIIIAGKDGGVHTEEIGMENTVDVFGGLEESDFVFAEGTVRLSVPPLGAGVYRLYESDTTVFYKNGSPVRTFSPGAYTAVGDFETLYVGIYTETEAGTELLRLFVGRNGEMAFTVEGGTLLRAMELDGTLSPKNAPVILRSTAQ